MRIGTILYFLLFVSFSCSDSAKESKKGIKQSDQIESKESIRILFAGDLLLDRGVAEQIKRKGIDFLFSGVDSVIRSHDYFVANLETPLTNIESPLNKKYIFRSDPKHASSLKNHGISHVIMSNNHTMDQGKEGLKDSYENLIQAGIVPVGYGDQALESCRPILIESGKHSIALFSSVQIPIENWFQVDEQPGVCQFQGEELEDRIKDYHDSNPEHKIIVNLHWGMEYLSTPNFSQMQHAKNLIDAGADAIVGHHPHVIQSMEEYKGKMIYYSIGNFIFDSKNPISKKALMVSIQIDEKGVLSCSKIPIKIRSCRPEYLEN